MIFVRDKGRMCNNILQYGHVYAWCRENGRKCMSMRFAYKYQYFHICHTKYHNFLTYLFAKLGGKMGFIPILSFDDPNFQPSILDSQPSTRNYIIEGWYIRFYDLFLKYKEDICQLFAFDKAVEDKVLPLIKEDTINIGVHVRRGDYKTFYDGKFYYDDETYVDLIQRMVPLVAEQFQDKKINVFICGNADLSNIKFLLSQHSKNLPINYITPNGNPAEDLCLFSKCDYLIGPPSTFTLVGSMYGKAQLYWVKDPKEEFAFSSFDTFENLFRNIL